MGAMTPPGGGAGAGPGEVAGLAVACRSGGRAVGRGCILDVPMAASMGAAPEDATEPAEARDRR